MTESAKKDVKMSSEQVEMTLRLMVLQKSALLNKLRTIIDSDIPNEDKFQQLAELINPIGGSSENS